MKTTHHFNKPSFKTRKTDTGFELCVALPGVPKNALNVDVEKNTLTIRGLRKGPEGQTNSHLEERQYRLRLNLHEDYDPTQISARYQNGILTLTLKKRKELAPRKIDILAN